MVYLNNKESIIEAIKNKKLVFRRSTSVAPQLLSFIFLKYKTTEDRLLQMIKNDPKCYQYTSLYIQDHFKMIKFSLKHHRWAIYFASPRLQKNQRIIMAMLKKYSKQVKNIAHNLSCDLENYYTETFCRPIFENRSSAIYLHSIAEIENYRIDFVV